MGALASIYSEGVRSLDPPNNYQSLSIRRDCWLCSPVGGVHYYNQCPGLGCCNVHDVCCSYFAASNGACTNNCTLSDGINYVAYISTNFRCGE